MNKVHWVAVIGVLLVAGPCLADLRFTEKEYERMRQAMEPGIWEGLLASLTAIIAGVRDRLRTRAGRVLLLMLVISGGMVVWKWHARRAATPVVEVSPPATSSFPRASGGP